MSQAIPLVDEVLDARRLLANAKNIRVRNGITQARLAQEVPVDRTSVGRWESGLASPVGRQRDRYLEILRALEDLS